MLTKSTCLKFYKRKDIQEAIVNHAQHKEIGMRYNEAFGKRPDTLTYPRDVLELALREATSFHASEELWENPLNLSSSLSKKELDQLRTGWDLVLDIDCKIVDYSRIAAAIIIDFLKYCGVKDISVKFSGNKGFHIGVPFEAFPKKVGEMETKDLFPDAAKKIAYYIKENIKKELGKQILEIEKGDIARIKEKVNLSQEEVTRYELDEDGDKIAKLNVDKFLEIDTILISPRHLYRMPYSLHEKSGLVSLPLDPSRVLEFEKNIAQPDKVPAPSFIFLDRKVQGESARRLLLQALDFEVKTTPEKVSSAPKNYDDLVISSPISPEFFPPCIQQILAGVEDGKKRSIFILGNFLVKIGWNKAQIEELLYKWNTEKNKEPLREVYIKGQLAHLVPGERLPPNCDNDAYYPSMGIACNAEHCQKFKNPVNYTLSKWRRHLYYKAEDEEKESRKKSKSVKIKEIPNPNKNQPSEEKSI